MNYWRAFSPPCEGGVAAPLRKWSHSEKARTGWSLAGHASQCILKHLPVSDHPVCGASVAFATFFDTLRANRRPVRSTPPQGLYIRKLDRPADGFRYEQVGTSPRVRFPSK